LSTLNPLETSYTFYYPIFSSSFEWVYHEWSLKYCCLKNKEKVYEQVNLKFDIFSNKTLLANFLNPYLMKANLTLSAPKPFVFILLSGLIVGTVDGMAAVVWHYATGGHDPAGIFKFIASCLIGKSAFEGGTEIVLLGVFLHYFIATIFSAFFYFLCSRVKAFRGNNLSYGALYGLFVWAVMNLIVLPIIIHSIPSNPRNIIMGLIIHMLCVGIPMSMVLGRFSSNRL
jgi:hypothetical protein